MSLVIYGIDHSSLKVTPIGNRMYKIADPVHIAIHTSEGTLVLDIKPYFVTNFRSGGRLVDGIVDQMGDENKALIYLIHDCFFTRCCACNNRHPISKELADIILREGLKFYGMHPIKAELVYQSVRIFGRSAYEKDDIWTPTNSTLFSFNWVA